MHSILGRPQGKTFSKKAFSAANTGYRAAHQGRSSVVSMASFHDLVANDIDGNEVKFDSFKGKVVLVTNVASACGYTKGNYTELSAMYAKYKDQGLEIMAFPCNQFGRQESGSNETIKSFVKDKFGVEFLMMDKVEVNGPNTSPVYKFLKSGCAGCDGDVSWNFAAKFIIDKAGNVVERKSGSPSEAEALIKTLLAA